MPSAEIPTLSGAAVTTHDYTIRVTLEQRKWDLRFQFNDRAQVWCVTVTATGETLPMVAQAPLWLGVDALRYGYDSRLPGKLIAMSRGSVDAEAGLLELGRACVLLYISLDETGVEDVAIVPRRTS